MTYFCNQKCFWKARLWTPGESLESGAGDQKPPEAHFSAEPPPAAPVKINAIDLDEPLTMSEIAGVTKRQGKK